MIIGYAKNSSRDQDLARQIDELVIFGCDEVFVEKNFGGSANERKEYKKLREKLRFGDVIVVHSLGRFGRNIAEIKDEWESLIIDKVDIVVLDMPILDTRQFKDPVDAGGLIAEIVPSLLTWVIEEQKMRIRSVRREGIENAKKLGKYKGRKVKYHSGAQGKDKIVYEDIIKSLSKGTSVMDIHRKTGVSRNTIYSIRNEVTGNDFI